MRISRASTVGFLVAFLTIGAPAHGQTPAVSQVVDQRPAKQKIASNKAAPGASLITSCNYYIVLMSDTYYGLDVVSLINKELENTSPKAIARKSLILTKYDIYYNGHNFYRNEVNKGFTGIVPAIMEGMGANCPREKTFGGWYEASEVTTPHSPFVVEISLQIDGKTYQSRTVYSPPEQIYVPRKPNAQVTAAMSEAISRANRALSAKLASEVPQ